MWAGLGLLSQKILVVVRVDVGHILAEEVPHVGSDTEGLFVEPLGHLVHFPEAVFILQDDRVSSFLPLVLTLNQL